MLDPYITEATQCDFKQSLEVKKPKSWLKTVCAFANGIGGTLLFGVDDNGFECMSDRDSFKVILYNVNHAEHSTNSTINSTIKSNSNNVLSNFEPLNDTVNGTENCIENSTENRAKKPLPVLQIAILKVLEEAPHQTLEDIARLVGYPKTTVRYHVQKLQKLGKIRREGSTKSGTWIVL